MVVSCLEWEHSVAYMLPFLLVTQTIEPDDFSAIAKLNHPQVAIRAADNELAIA